MIDVQHRFNVDVDVDGMYECQSGVSIDMAGEVSGRDEPLNQHIVFTDGEPNSPFMPYASLSRLNDYSVLVIRSKRF